KAEYAERGLVPVGRACEEVVEISARRRARERGRRAVPEDRIDRRAPRLAAAAVTVGGERELRHEVWERLLGGARDDRLERRADRDRQVPIDALGVGFARLAA